MGLRQGAALVTIVVAGCAHPRIPPAPPPARLVIRLPPSHGSVVARLDQPIGTDHSKTGQAWTATTVAPIQTASGRFVPAGARIEGHVRRLVAGHGVTPPVLELAVDELRYRDHARPLNARIAAEQAEDLAAPPSSEPVNRGAVGGAIVGAVFLGIPGALLGYGIGRGGGIATSLRRRELDVKLPAGSFVTIDFDTPVDW
jgi:hypothetical protein